MFKPRHMEGPVDWLEEAGIKIYTLSASNNSVDQAKYLPRLKEIKVSRGIDWINIPAFALSNIQVFKINTVGCLLGIYST